MKKHWLKDKVWGRQRDPFWSTITLEELDQILANDSCLTGELKERFCRLNEINDPPAGPLQILVNVKDAEKLARQKEK